MSIPEGKILTAEDRLQLDREYEETEQLLQECYRKQHENKFEEPDGRMWNEVNIIGCSHDLTCIQISLEKGVRVYG